MKAFEAKSSIDYPRKRASIACNFCRHRKRKCDGQKPTCGLCTDAGAQCNYQESERVQDVPAEILFRLNHLEVLLEQQKDAIAKLTAQVASSSSLDPSVQSLNASLYSSQLRYNWDPPNETQYDRSSLEFPSQQSPQNYEVPFSIPLGDNTPTGSLFALDRIKYLIGDYPHDFFYLLENKRPFDDFKTPGIPQSIQQIDQSLLRDPFTGTHVHGFFEHVHPFFPIIDPCLVNSLFETFPASTKANVRTSLCLVILALGKVSSNADQIFDIEAQRELSGVEYFATAYHDLNKVVKPFCSTDHFLPLALFYASLYLRYIGRPVQAWQLIEHASTSVQFMISRLHDTSPDAERASLYRTAWGCYILECDDLTEFQFPHSGIEAVVDKLLFDKLLFPEISNSEHESKSRAAFLAMCSIRKILSRVQENSHSISSAQHTNDTTKSPQTHWIGSLEKFSKIFDHELDDWFKCLPPTIKPNLGHDVAKSQDDPYDNYIRARYYATQHIICRPSLLFAAQLNMAIPVYIYENCKKCIDSCRKFIYVTSILLRKRTHATWLKMQALLAAIFTLSIAKTTPGLAAIVGDFDILLKDAILSIQPWAVYFETADTILSMMKTIYQKVRVSV